MGTVSRHGKGWRAQVRRKGHKPLSATFPLKKQAEAWRDQRESEIVQGRLGILPQHTLGEALERFRLTISKNRPGRRWEEARLKVIERSPLAREALATLDESDMAEWRDAELARPTRAGKPREGTTVRRVMALMAAVFDVAIREWRWMNRSPLKGVTKPPPKPGRRRGLRQAEIDAVVKALGYAGGEPRNDSQQTAIAFLLAIETAMRSGEILALTWPHVREKHVHLPKTKNGDARDVPLSGRARELIDAMRGVHAVNVFTVDPATRDKLFRDGRKRAGLAGFTFHDSRSEAISRLAKKLEPLELAKMVGQRDLRSLMHYYTDDPDEVADKL